MDNMINIKKRYLLCKEHNIPYLKFCKKCDKMNFLICNEVVNKEHYFSKKHIDNFNKNISIKIKTSIKKKFIDIIFDFHIIDKNVFIKIYILKTK